MGLEIKKTASYVPNNTIKNEYFEKYLDTTDEWISSRTGINERHFAISEGTSDMVTKVCCGLDIYEEQRKNIKAVIVSTLSSDVIIPNLASLVQKELNLNKNIFATDINMACSGFVGGLKIADAILKEGEYAIVIGAEHLSKITNMQDRATAVLFGDGAGGVLVKKNNEKTAYDFGCYYSNVLALNTDDKIAMDGKEVYRFAVNTLVSSIEKVLVQLDKKPDDIDYFISHQANEKIIKSACRKWGISSDKFPMNIKTMGNTSSASIPILLDELNKEKKIKSDSEIIFCGFGGGLTWVSCFARFCD